MPEAAFCADFHVHTTFCDGKNTPEEMVLAALKKGLRAIGFSGHAFTPFDTSWCMSPEGTAAYRREVLALREKYAGRIRILLGLEQDLYSPAPEGDWDYRIGSVHYLRLPRPAGYTWPHADTSPVRFPADGDYIYLPVDESPALLRAAADRFFDGDRIALAEAYYRQEAEVAEVTGCDIIGHFDLIEKFNEGSVLFDTDAPRLRDARDRALDRLLDSGAVFEINTGAMSRGLRASPYPAAALRARIAARGGRMILSGDAHTADGLCHAFEDYAAEAVPCFL